MQGCGLENSSSHCGLAIRLAYVFVFVFSSVIYLYLYLHLWIVKFLLTFVLRADNQAGLRLVAAQLVLDPALVHTVHLHRAVVHVKARVGVVRRDLHSL